MPRDRIVMLGAISALTLALIWGAKLLPGGTPNLPGLLTIGSIVDNPPGPINFDSEKRKRCREQQARTDSDVARRDIRIEVEGLQQIVRHERKHIHRHVRHAHKHAHKKKRKRCKSRVFVYSGERTPPVPPVAPLAPVAPTPPIPPVPPLPAPGS